MSVPPGPADGAVAGSDVVPASPAPAGSVSPLDTYLMPRSLLEPTDPAVARAREDEVERRVAVCMAARGFTYVPVLGRSPAPDPSARDEPEPGSRAWAQRWGYGIATAPTGGIPDEVGGADLDPAADPNPAIVAALDPARRRDYERSLYGRAFDDDPIGSSPDRPDGDENGAPGNGAPGNGAPGNGATGSGAEARSGVAGAAALDAACRTIAIRAVYGWTTPRAFRWPDGMDPWADRARIHEAAHRDPRVVAALADWSRRMAQAGHAGFTDLDGPAALVAEQRARIVGDPAHEAAPEPDRNNRLDRNDWLDRLARDEVALAVADWDARAASRVVAIMVDVRWEREREYIAAHREALRAYRDTIAAG